MKGKEIKLESKKGKEQIYYRMQIPVEWSSQFRKFGKVESMIIYPYKRSLVCIPKIEEEEMEQKIDEEILKEIENQRKILKKDFEEIEDKQREMILRKIAVEVLLAYSLRAPRIKIKVSKKEMEQETGENKTGENKKEMEMMKWWRENWEALKDELGCDTQSHMEEINFIFKINMEGREVGEEIKSMVDAINATLKTLVSQKEKADKEEEILSLLKSEEGDFESYKNFLSNLINHKDIIVSTTRTNERSMDASFSNYMNYLWLVPEPIFYPMSVIIIEWLGDEIEKLVDTLYSVLKNSGDEILGDIKNLYINLFLCQKSIDLLSSIIKGGKNKMDLAKECINYLFYRRILDELHGPGKWKRSEFYPISYRIRNLANALLSLVLYKACGEE